MLLLIGSNEELSQSLLTVAAKDRRSISLIQDPLM